MSESYDPELVFLPSTERQTQIFYDQISNVQPGPLQKPEYAISGGERLNEVREVLSGREGEVELRYREGEQYEVVESFENFDLGQYIDEKLSADQRPEDEYLMVEGVGSFDLELRDGDFLTGYVLTGRKHIPDELPKPMMAEIQVFADPRKDSSAVIKVQQEP